MKSRLLFILSAIFAMVLLAGCNSADSDAGNPIKGDKGEGQAESAINGTIVGMVGFGAGGQTDLVSRAIAPVAERELGQSIVVTNKPGASGAIAMADALGKKPDGTTIYFSAENPAVYEILGISDKGFDDLYPINLFSSTLTAFIVPANSKYETMDDLIADAQKNPGKVKIGSSGPGGLEFALAKMLENTTATEFNLVPFDGGGAIITALLGSHIDATAVGMSNAVENVNAGKVRILAINSTERLDDFADVPTIIESIPEMKRYLPWGPFYGVWVRNDTPDNIKEELVQAFNKAQKSPEFQDFLKRTNGDSLGLSGEEAVEYWKNWQSTTAWLMHDAGVTKKSPEELNIKKPE